MSIFTYDNTNNNDLFNRTESSLGLTNTNAINSSYISGDFNGDAIMDVIVYPKTGADKNKKYWLITNTNTGGYNLPKEHNVGTFEDIFPVNWLNHNNKLMTSQGWSVVKKIGNQYKFSIYSTGTTNPIYFQYEKIINDFPVFNPIFDYCTGGGVFPKKILSGDFNGDGLTDVIAIDNTSLSINCPSNWGSGWSYKANSRKVYFIDLNRNKTTDFWNLAGLLSENLPDLSSDYDIQVGDFNGDGKSDFFVIQEKKITVYSLDDNNQLIILATITNDVDIKKDKPHLLGDYNGDGKIDLVIPTHEAQDRWVFYFSKGNGFYKKIGSIGFNYGPFYSGNVRIAGVFYANVTVERYYIPNDINGDGRTDIVFVGNYTYNSNGNNIVTFTNVIENMGSTSSSINFNFDSNNSTAHYQSNIKKYPLPIFLNHNNINQNLELGLLSGSKIHNFKHTKDHRQDVLLRQVSTGNGVVETINYKPLVEENNPDEIQVYRPTYDETYPNVDIKNVSAIQVVSKLEKQSKDQYSKQIFSYYGAVSNVEGLGFLGFKSSYRSNWYNDDHGAISNVTKHDISKRGAVYESYSSKGIQYSFQNTPSDFIGKTLNNYTVNLSPKKVFKLTNTSSTSYNGLQNTSVTSTMTYDSYNNPLTNTSVIKEGGATQQTVITTLTYEHNPNGGSSLSNPYYIGRVKKKGIQTSNSGDTFTSEEQYQYSNTMLLTQLKRKGDNTPFITENYDYDAFGNITDKTVSANGTSRVNSYEYENTGRFLIKETDVEGLQTQYQYDTNGYLQKETNPYGLITQYQYDVWGKSIKETDYLGNQTNIIYSRSGINTQFTINAPDGSKSYKKFDDLGREILIGSYGFAQKWDYIQTTYDIYDRKISVSEPYNGSASQYSLSSYDSYGRLNETVTAAGKTTNINYSGLTITATDGYKTVTTTKNGLGQIIRMTDDGGTINYQYFANGNLKRSTLGGIVTTMQYDGWGRKIKLTDPSAGVYQYEYNAFGETTKEITPKGETTFTLDNIGKLTQKIVQGELTNLQSNYIYDPATKLLKTINTNQNATYTYQYDNYKRLNKTIESNANAVFERTTTFDGLGRANTEQYKARNLSDNKISDIITKNIYKNGSLFKILNNANQSELWKINTVNQRGQITDAVYGNGIVESNSYDAYGLPTRIRTYENTEINLIDLNYTFNAQRGILLNRSNNLYAHQERFQYDNLNRLTQYTNAQGQQETQSYDGKGRITRNPVGSFAYANASKPYQNTSIALTGDYYDEDNAVQNISYNAFKAPVSIYVDTGENSGNEITFEYNIFQQRSTVQFKKHEPQEIHYKTKHYATDGTMEITQNLETNQTEFITYIGGDAYSAPIVYKHNGSTGNFIYLHRDYLGSIIGITNKDAELIEKRHFDAWGNTVLIKDGQGNTLDNLTTLDRGYTGHEHLASVGLINMNARLYDANLHRFLAPDNFVQDAYNTQNYNRYSYANNNPLSYVDPSGEIVWVAVAIGALIGAVTGAAGYIAGAIQTGNWNWGQFGLSILGGAIIGGITGGFSPMSVMSSTLGGAAAVGFISGFLPSINIPIGDWSFSISPAIAFGNASGVGFNFGVSYSDGNWSFSAGVGYMYYGNYNGFGNGVEIRKSIMAAWDDGSTGFSLGTNFWNGKFKQQTGIMGFRSGDFNIQHENDFFGDGEDRLRTAGLELGYKSFTVGFSLFTGDPTLDSSNDPNSNGKRFRGNTNPSDGSLGPNGSYIGENASKYRLGAAYVGYRGLRLGQNSEQIRGFIQNGLHNKINSPRFPELNNLSNLYFQYQTKNSFTLW
ncbi:MAG: polymorphic toxin type 23 domain-containing protein [Flavobacteriaceae bacterium]|nr:polymorphic toxin type 23 domain-containing protein [Flavobacteriaceae bacterium]